MLAAAASAAATGVPASEEVVLTAQERANVERWDRFVAAGTKSSELRLRVIFSTDGLEKRKGSVIYWRETIPLESLVDQARGSTDPMVLALLFARCFEVGNPKRCDALDFAERWTVADTQNQLAWIVLSSELQRRGDRNAARAAFERAAQASTWHEYSEDVARVSVRALPRAPTPRERLFDLDAATSTAAASTIAIVPHTYMRVTCEEPSRREACARILDTMFRDGDTLLGTAMSAQLAKAAGLSDEAVRARKQRYHATAWALTQFSVRQGAELDDPAMIARAVDETEQRISLGDMGWGRRLLQQAGVSEADAAARYGAAHPSVRP